MIDQELRELLSSVLKTKLKLAQWNNLFNSIHNQLINHLTPTNQAIVTYFLKKVELVEIRNQNMFALLAGEINSDIECQNIISEYLMIGQDWREIGRFIDRFNQLVHGRIPQTFPTDGQPDPYILEAHLAVSSNNKSKLMLNNCLFD